MSLPAVFTLAQAPRNLAPGTRIHRRPGLWWCAHPLPVAQLNTARPTGPADWPQLIDAVWATSPGVSRWSLPQPDPALTAALDAAGWARRGRFVALRRAPVAGEALPSCAPETWAEGWFGARGRRRPPSDWGALGSLTWAWPGGGVGAMWVDRWRRIGVLWGAAVAPSARGQGGWRALLSARLDAAHRLGLREVWTVAQEDETAPALVRAGFSQEPGGVEVWEREG